MVSAKAAVYFVFERSVEHRWPVLCFLHGRELQRASRKSRVALFAVQMRTRFGARSFIKLMARVFGFVAKDHFEAGSGLPSAAYL